MTKFFSLIGLVCAAMVALVFWAASSDIQIILAGVFAVAAINAFGFAAVVHRLDRKPATQRRTSPPPLN